MSIILHELVQVIHDKVFYSLHEELHGCHVICISMTWGIGTVSGDIPHVVAVVALSLLLPTPVATVVIQIFSSNICKGHAIVCSTNQPDNIPQILLPVNQEETGVGLLNHGWIVVLTLCEVILQVLQ